MRTRRSALGACIVMASLLAACGGAGGNAVPAPASTQTPQGTPANVAISFVVPATSSSTTATAKPARKSNYMSAATQGIGISVVAHGGTFPARVTPAEAYDVSATSALCTAGAAGSRTCTFYVPAPAGNDDFQITAWDAKPIAASFVGAHVLSAGSVLGKSIVASSANTIAFVMQGTINSVYLRLSSNTMLAGIVNNTYTVDVEAIDADGNIITGSDPFIDSNGNALTVAVNVTTSGGPGTVTLSPGTTVTNPSNSRLTVNYNGALLSSALFSATPSLPIAGTNTKATLSFTISNPNLNVLPNPVVTTYAVAAGSNPMGIAASGVDGNLYFADNGSKAIGLSTTSGTLSTKAGGTAAAISIAYGRDGDMYFTEANGTFGRINPNTFAVQENPGRTGAALGDITQGPLADNDMWFTDTANNAVGCVGFGAANAGTNCPGFFGVAEYTAAGKPAAIVLGPDGNVWYTLSNSAKVATMTTSGAAPATYTLSGPGKGIAVGADGNLWITEPSVNKIAQVTTSGTVSEFGGVTAGSNASQIAGGIDGALWFLEPGTGKIGRVTTAGVVTEFPTGLSASANLTGITSGPDGNLWFTAPGANAIGKVQP